MLDLTVWMTVRATVLCSAQSSTEDEGTKYEGTKYERVREGPSYCSLRTSGRVLFLVIRALQAPNAHYFEGEVVHKLVDMTAIISINDALLLTLRYNLQAIPTTCIISPPYLSNIILELLLISPIRASFPQRDRSIMDCI